MPVIHKETRKAPKDSLVKSHSESASFEGPECGRSAKILSELFWQFALHRLIHRLIADLEGCCCWPFHFRLLSADRSQISPKLVNDTADLCVCINVNYGLNADALATRFRCFEWFP